MIYTTRLRRLKAATSLASDLAQHGPLIAKELEPRMAAVLEEGEKMPDVGHLLDVIGRMLVLESEGLRMATEARSVEGTQANLARSELRESAEPELRKRVIWVRDRVRGAYGAKEASRLLRLKGRTPRAREDLKELAEHMVSFLPKAEPPKAIAGPPPKPADWVEYLRPALTDFNHYLDELGKCSASTTVAGRVATGAAGGGRRESVPRHRDSDRDPGTTVRCPQKQRTERGKSGLSSPDARPERGKIGLSPGLERPSGGRRRLVPGPGRGMWGRSGPL